MTDTSGMWQKVGGPLALALVVLFFWGGWQLSRADSVVEDAEATTAVGTPALSSTIEPTYAPGALPILSETGLAPDPKPLTYQGKLPQHELQTYVVKRGDTPNAIAAMFGIQPATLLGGNPRLSEESNLLQTGFELIILPIDGVLHDVQPGETVESVAALYGVSVDAIIGYAPNNLEFPYRLYPQTQILVPGAVREVFVWNPPSLESVRGTSWEGRNVRPLVVGTGTFIFPVSSRNFSQYYWYGHRAIDIALPEGNSVFASDTGTVTYAGWNTYGYGNLIVINHGNGHETFYAHLSSINVSPGQIVYQGNLIGLTGNTGQSSGPHIHFEIRLNGNQDDPCWYLGC